MEPWDTLGIEPTNDIRAIKKAYSAKLKTARPDDDAAAYQALREAYEAAQWWVNQGLVTPLDEVAPVSGHAKPVDDDHTAHPLETQAQESIHIPLAEAVEPELHAQPEQSLVSAWLVEPSEPMLPMAQGPSVEQLVLSCVAQLEQNGELQFVRMWPELQQQLEDLPIAQHQEASRRFAVFVLQQDVPVEVMIALTQSFQWGLDYRMDSQLGQELSMALQTKLQQAHVYAVVNQRSDPADAWTLALARLVDQGRTSWMRVFAVCMDHVTRQRITQTSPLLLRALGASKKSSQVVVAAAALGGIWQALLLMVLFIAAAHMLFALSGTYLRNQDWQFNGFGAALLLGIYSYFYSEVSYIDRWWPSLRRWLIAQNWRPICTVSVPLFVVFAMVKTADGASIDSIEVLVPLSALCFFIWLMLPTDEQAWRKLFLPTFVLLLVGLAGLFPELSNVVLLSLAFGWVLVAHFALSRFSHWFEATYQGVVKLRFLRERPFLILGIKFVGAAWLLFVLACLPMLLFRLCSQRGLLYAQVAMVGGVLLSGAVHPASGATWLLACTVIAVFAIHCSQWGLQKLAEFGLRKLVS